MTSRRPPSWTRAPWGISRLRTFADGVGDGGRRRDSRPTLDSAREAGARTYEKLLDIDPQTAERLSRAVAHDLGTADPEIDGLIIRFFPHADDYGRASVADTIRWIYRNDAARRDRLLARL